MGLAQDGWAGIDFRRGGQMNIKSLYSLVILLFLAPQAYGEITGVYTFPEGSNGEVQFESDGLFYGDSDFTFSTTTNRVTVSSAAVTYLTVTSETVTSLSISSMTASSATITLGTITSLTASTATVSSMTVTAVSVSGLTPSRAVVTGSGGSLQTSAVTSTELGYVSGVTSAIQTQLDNLGASDAWFSAGETWSYISANSFSVSGDKTGKYQKGDKIKLTQTSVKYFYVIDVAYTTSVTTITVTGGTDYTLANAAITSPYFSKAATPQGFPDWFNYTPTMTSGDGNASIGNGTIVGRFSIDGKTVRFRVLFTFGSTTSFGSGDIRFSLPVNITTAVYHTNENNTPIGFSFSYDNNTGNQWHGIAARSPTNNDIVALHYKAPQNDASWVTATTPMTWTNGDQLGADAVYEMQ